MPISNDEVKRNNQMANLKPFVKSESLTEEEKQKQSDICRNGAYARMEKQREKRNLQQTTLALLETKLSREQAQNMIGKQADLIPDENLDMQTVLSVRLATALLDDGNAKAFELLRDTSGQGVKAKSEIELSGNLMTDADRSLLEKITARMGISGDP